MEAVGRPISLCVLFYGDYMPLAHRCVSSIWSRMTEGAAHLQDVRLAMNEVSESTRGLVHWFADNAARHYGVPVITYDMPVNACKYPVMRRMLLDDPRAPAPWSLWFDDDSYLDGAPGWWDRLLARASQADMLGKIYNQRMQPAQWDWIHRQGWFNPVVGPPPNNRFVFCTGGWWMIRSSVLRDHNWPPPELRHRGGDSLLGELCRHQQLRLVGFEDGVRINADDRGRHSKSPRRGVDEPVLGSRPATNQNLQEFNMHRRIWS